MRLKKKRNVYVETCHGASLREKIRKMVKMLRNTILFLGILLLNCGFLNSSESTKEVSYPFIGADMHWVDSVFNTMTLDEKIGQLFMVAAYSDPKQDNEEAVKKLIT